MHHVRLACALAFALAAPLAVAQVRPSSPPLTCQAARQIVASQGAAVLSTGRYAYDRYVSSSRFCALGETTEPAWIPTADSAQCFVGYRCRQPDLELSDR
jgi:hypothetical protein